MHGGAAPAAKAGRSADAKPRAARPISAPRERSAAKPSTAGQADVPRRPGYTPLRPSSGREQPVRPLVPSVLAPAPRVTAAPTLQASPPVRSGGTSSREEAPAEAPVAARGGRAVWGASAGETSPSPPHSGAGAGVGESIDLNLQVFYKGQNVVGELRHARDNNRQLEATAARLAEDVRVMRQQKDELTAQYTALEEQLAELVRRHKKEVARLKAEVKTYKDRCDVLAVAPPPPAPAAPAAPAANDDGDDERSGGDTGDEGHDAALDSDVEVEVGALFRRDPARAVKKAMLLEGDGFLLDDGAGEQAGAPGAAARPWAAPLAKLQPSGWKGGVGSGSPPDDELEIDFVYGYRAHDCRSNLFYLSRTGEELVYHSAAVGVVYNVERHTQRHFAEHDDDILCLAVHPDGKLVATGQVGPEARILVWDAETMTRRATLKGAHKKGVCAIAFSPDGTKLASVGLDDAHTLALWDWSRSAVLAAAKCGASRIFSIAFNPLEPSGSAFATVGIRHAGFWSYARGALECRKGVFGGGGKGKGKGKGKGAESGLADLHCLAYQDGSTLLTGSGAGEILHWSGNVCAGRTKLPDKGPVFSIYACKGGIVCGGKDGKVHILDRSFQPGGKPMYTFDLGKIAAGMIDRAGRPLVHSDTGAGAGSRPAVRSLCWVNGKILVGTKTSEIYEIKGEQTTLLLQGHSASGTWQGKAADYQGELWALATHPRKSFFATAGEDRTIRIWSIADRRPVGVRKLKSQARAAAYAPGGELVAVGCLDGSFVVLEAESLAETCERRDRREAVTDLKFSPSGRFLAVAGSDGVVEVYDVSRAFAWQARCKGHTSGVVHLDWSEDSQYIQSCSTDYELLFWTAATGTQIKQTTVVRDVSWFSQTCTIGWPVQGVLPPGADGSDVNAVDRTHYGDIVATGDDYRYVNLYRYPCLNGAKARRYRGHSEHVTCVRFTWDDRFLISTGGADLTVIQWRHKGPNAGKAAPPPLPSASAVVSVQSAGTIAARRKSQQGLAAAREEGEEAAEEVSEGEEEVAQELARTYERDERRQRKRAIVDGGEEYGLDEGRGEEAGAPGARPWVRAVQGTQPSNYQPDPKLGQPPAADLQLDFVYGYRAHDARNNLFFARAGEKPDIPDTIVYHTAGVGIVYSQTKHRQRHFLGHDDDILCLAMHPEGKQVATGQTGKKPHIIVWDVETLTVKAKLLPPHGTGVGALAFSPDGNKLVSVGLDSDHTIVLWDWRKAKSLASDRGDGNKIFGACFNPCDSNAFATVGVRHIRFWAYSPQSGKLTGKRGVYGKIRGITEQRAFHSIAWLTEGTVLAGTADGDLYHYAFDGQGSYVCKGKTKAHRGPVFALYAWEGGVISGGKDGKVVHYDPRLNLVNTYDVGKAASTMIDTRGRPLVYFPTPNEPCVRSLCIKGSSILVGTLSSQIFTIDIACPTMASATRLVLQGHCASGLLHGKPAEYQGELWGLAVDRRRRIFLTAGDDKTLRIWDADTRRQIALRVLTGSARSCDISPDGRWAAVGLEDGSLVCIDTDSLADVAVKKERKLLIADVKFSPNGRLLAVGSHDGFVDVYDTTKRFQRIGSCKGHASGVAHLDWSQDSQFIQSNSLDYELLFWKAEGCTQVRSPSALRDTAWATCTCTIGWPMQGIYPPCADGSDVNAADRSRAGFVIATGDDFRCVNLYRYPAAVEHAQCKRYIGHSEHVTCVRFLCDDSFLITTGGADLSVFQWRFLDPDAPPVVLDDIATHEDGLDSADDSDVENELRRGVREREPTRQAKRTFLDNDVYTLDEGVGEEFMATRPWLETVKRTQPSNWVGVAGHGAEPPNELNIEFVYGYRAHDARNNVRYVPGAAVVRGGEALEDIAWHTAGVAVVYNKPGHRQRFFTGHDDDILCLAVHPDGKLVATGQVGKKPPIYVWDSDKMTVKAKLVGPHARGVTAVAWSPDGTKLASVGLDDNHSVVVWDWANGAVLASDVGGKDQIFSVTWNPFDRLAASFVTCGSRHIKFWSLTGRKLQSKRGIYSRKKDITPQKSLHACAWVDEGRCVVGTADGDLYVYEGNEATSRIRAHKGPVFVVSGHADGVLSGGKDGRIVVLDRHLSITRIVDLGKATLGLLDPTGRPVVFFNTAVPTIRSLELRSGSILVGTLSSNIVEVDEDGIARLVHQGHCASGSFLNQPADYQGELWGLATHPERAWFVTAGDDQSVRIFDMDRRFCVAVRKIRNPARTVAYSAGGKHVAIGCYGGEVVILDGKQLTDVFASNDRKCDVTDVKFSPNGRYLAVGYKDGQIDILDSMRAWGRMSVCKGHSAAVNHVDWSTDGLYLQSNCAAYELLFWTAGSGNRVKNSAAMRDIHWATQTCTIGWPVQGVYAAYADGSDVNAAAKSHSGHVVATGDDFRTVSVFKFPCIAEDAKRKKYAGHSEHVTNVRWSCNDSHLISTGGADLTVIQWRHRDPEVRRSADADVAADPALRFRMQEEELLTDADMDDGAAEEDSEVELEVAQKYVRDPDRSQKKPLASAHADAARAGVEEEEGGKEKEKEKGKDPYQLDLGMGEQFGAVRPFKTAVQNSRPSDFRPPRGHEEPPNEDLVLEFVHGYRGHDCRNNLFYLDSDEIVYHIAAVAVVLNTKSNSQRFFAGHDDDILCLAVHPSGSFVATGQVGKDPVIHVWDPDSMEAIATLKGAHMRGIACLAFSGDGARLVSVGLDDNHTVVVWEWRSGRRMFTERGDVYRIWSVAFNPHDNRSFVTVGMKHIRFWSIGATRMQSQRGIYANKNGVSVQRAIHSIAFTDETTCIAGTHDGDIYIFTGHVCQTRVKAHRGPVFALVAYGRGVVSGGRDGKVLVFDVRLNLARAVDLAKATAGLLDGAGRPLVHFGSGGPSVRAVAWRENRIALGTSSGAVFEIDKADGVALLAQGHGPSGSFAGKPADYQGELWGLAMHPRLPEYATVGEDRTLRLWSAAERRCLGIRKLPGPARACSYGLDAAHIAVALEDGTVLVADARALADVKRIPPCAGPDGHTGACRVVKYSPDGALLAVATHWGPIHVHDAASGYERVAALKGHVSHVTHLDWSKDGQFLQSLSNSYELLFWNVKQGAQVKTAGHVAQVKWATRTCPISWDTIGCYPPFADGSDVNAVDRSGDHGLLAIGDDFRCVSVARYPCVSDVAKRKKGRAHSEHVTCVRFTADDQRLVSTGGADLAVCQWRRVGAEVRKKAEAGADEAADEAESEDDSEVEREKPRPLPRAATRQEKRQRVDENDGFELDDGEGEQFGAVKPWIATVQALQPRDWRPSPGYDQEPPQKLELVHVHGYRGHDCRGNLFYLTSEEIVYNVAAVGVVQNIRTGAQRVFVKHDDDIISLAAHPAGSMVATGQVGKKPAIHVWDPRSLEVHATLTGAHERGICALAFSADGQRLASVGLDEHHTVIVWDWRQRRIIAQERGDGNRVFAVSFSPFEREGRSFITVGVKHVRFWSVNGGRLQCHRGTYGETKGVKPQKAMHSVGWLDETTALTGTSDGDLYVWSVIGAECTGKVRAHKGPAFAAAQLEGGAGVVSGGKDGQLVFLDRKLAVSRTVDLRKGLEALRARGTPLAAPAAGALSIRALCAGQAGRALVGTAQGFVLEVDGSGAVAVLVQGHGPAPLSVAGAAVGEAVAGPSGQYQGEVWALATHPRERVYATGGDDGRVYLFEADSKRVAAALALPGPVRALAFAPDGLRLAAAHGSAVVILDGHSLEPVAAARSLDVGGPVSDMKYSPDGSLLAVASRTRAITVFSGKELKQLGVCRGHSAAVLHMDFSADSAYLRSCCTAYELMLWEAERCERVRDLKRAANAEWASETCTIGWAVQGIYPPCADGSDVNAADRSRSGAVLATGDDFRCVNLFRYPAAAEQPKCKRYIGHSEHVTCVRFLHDDSFLLSTGGADLAVFQWRLVAR